MTRTLVIIDIQNDYFEGGAHPLVGPDAAAANAARLLASHREAGQPVVHVQHVWDAPDAAFFAPGSHGVEIHPLVAPDACAAPDLSFGTTSVPAAQVHAAFMAALDGNYAEVVSVDELLS